MSTDRELLELAAKAARIELCWFEIGEGDPDCNPGWYCTNVTSGGVWRPLTDDGDALRLANRCDLTISRRDGWVLVVGENYVAAQEFYKHDGDAATRRAIVRAAAELGRPTNG